MSLKLTKDDVGHPFVRRDGKVVHITSYDDDVDVSYPFCCEGPDSETGWNTVTPEGRFMRFQESNEDLVERYEAKVTPDDLQITEADIGGEFRTRGQEVVTVKTVLNNPDICHPVVCELPDGTEVEVARCGTYNLLSERESVYDLVAREEGVSEAIGVPADLHRLHETANALIAAAADRKDSNPKDAVGIQKAPISTVPFPVISELGVAMLEGALKYGRHNYRNVGVKASVYFDACVNRHLGAWWEGEDTDPDSGLSHLTKAIACLVVLRDAMIRGKMRDDRPVGTAGFIQHLNQKTKELLQKYPDPVPPFVAGDCEPNQYQP